MRINIGSIVLTCLPFMGTMTFATYDYYVAKGIGIVKVDSEGDPVLTNGIKTATGLYEYSIK